MPDHEAKCSPDQVVHVQHVLSSEQSRLYGEGSPLGSTWGAERRGLKALEDGICITGENTGAGRRAVWPQGPTRQDREDGKGGGRKNKVTVEARGRG